MFIESPETFSDLITTAVLLVLGCLIGYPIGMLGQIRREEKVTRALAQKAYETAERARQAAEWARRLAERDRVKVEGERVVAEGERVVAEDERVVAETVRREGPVVEGPAA